MLRGNNKFRLILWGVFPLLLGIIFIYALTRSSYSNVRQYIFLVFLLFGWYQVGKYFAGQIKNFIAAVVLGNLIGIISFLLFSWQVVFITAEKQSLSLINISRAFSAPLTNIVIKVTGIFAKDQIPFIENLSVSYQAIGLLLMMLVFYAGWLNGRKKIQKYRDKFLAKGTRRKSFSGH